MPSGSLNYHSTGMGHRQSQKKNVLKTALGKLKDKVGNKGDSMRNNNLDDFDHSAINYRTGSQRT